MKIKKVIAFTLALLLLMAACAPDGQQAGQGGQQAGQGGQQAGQQAQAPAAPGEVDRSERIVISYAAVAMVEGVDYNADEISQHFAEKFNIEWDPIGLTWDNWAERIRIWINAHDMPDFVMWDFNFGDYVNYVDQGLIRQLPGDFRTRWPNMGRVFDTSVVGPVLEERMGGAHMIPRIIYFDKPTDPFVAHQNLYIRQDWAREVGFEVRDAYSARDLMDFARLLQVADPVGNSRTIPIDMNINALASVFVGPFNPNFAHYYRGADGRFHWGPASEGTLEGLRLYSQAFREGLINPDFFALRNNEEIANFQSGVSGVIFHQGFGRGMKLLFDRYYLGTEGRDPRNDIHMSILLGDDGHHHIRENTNFWTASIFSPQMEDHRFERLMDVLEYASTEEGQNLIRMGFEGRDWERDAAGEITILREMDEQGNFINLDRLYPSLNPLWNNLTILPDDFGLRDPGMDADIREIVIDRFNLKQRLGGDVGTVVPIDWDMFFFTSPAFERTRFNFGEEFARLVTMDGDIEVNWRNWVNEQMPMVQMVLDEMNAQFAP